MGPGFEPQRDHKKVHFIKLDFFVLDNSNLHFNKILNFKKYYIFDILMYKFIYKSFK